MVTIIIIILLLVLIYYLIFPVQHIEEGMTNDEALQNLASLAALYNTGQVTVSNLKTTGNTDVAGELHTGVIKNDGGRLHIAGSELLYLLNKNGVEVGKEWGGNGNLHTQGSVSASEGVNAPFINLGGKFRLSGAGDAYGNDEWLRLMKGDGGQAYAGGVAADKLHAEHNLHAGSIDTGPINAGSLKIGSWTISDSGGNLIFQRDGQNAHVHFEATGNDHHMGLVDGNGWISRVSSAGPCRGDRAAHDGGLWSRRTCGGDWAN